MKKHSAETNTSFHQRKQRRIQERQPDPKTEMFVYDGCTISGMRVFAWLNWQKTQVIRTNCQHSTTGDMQPKAVTRISKRNEPLRLSCDCANTKCGHHQQQKKRR